MLAGIHEFLRFRQLHKQRGSGIRDDASGFLAQRAEHMRKSQRRPHGIAVRPHMAYYGYFAGIGYKMAQAAHYLVFYYAAYHCGELFRKDKQHFAITTDGAHQKARMRRFP